MSVASRVHLTPRRKCASSNTSLVFKESPTTAVSAPKIPTTPGLRSLPDIGWDDTPQSLDLSPRTPNSVTVLSNELFTKDGVYDTPTRSVKEPRRSSRLEAKAALQHDASKIVSPKIEHSDLKPILLFPPALYPTLPAATIEHAAKSYFVKGDIGPRSFKFQQLSREEQKLTGQNFQHADVAVPTQTYAPRNVQEQERTRIRQAASKDEERSQYVRTMISGSQTTTVEAKSVVQNPFKQSNRKISAPIATSKVFSRILPMDVVDRLIEKPTRCVASLDRKPHERCSQSIPSPGDAKRWLATRTADLEDSSDLIACHSYLAELVQTTTCTRYHRKLATPQLARLLDRHRGRSHNDSDKLDFTEPDMKALQNWLIAWTKQPDSQSSQQPQQECATSRTVERVIVQESHIVSSSLCEDVSPNDSTFQSSAARVKIITSATDAIALRTRENSKTTVDSIESSEILNITKRVEVTKTVGEIEIPNIGDVYQAVRSSETNKTTETTYTVCPDSGDGSIGAESEVITMTNTTETISTAETTVESTGDKQHVEKTSTVRTMQCVKTVSEFCPPPVDTTYFSAGPKDSATKSLRVEKRLTTAHVKELQTLCQSFVPLIRKSHLSVEEYIRQCLVRPLTKREWTKPSEGNSRWYPKRDLDYPGQGLIYMYWLPGNFGYVKIGKTSGESTQTRLRDWAKQCGHPTEEHTNGEEEVAVQLPHAFRVEALVHAELRDFGIEEETCGKCRKSHTEWFKVPSGLAQKVITKWSNWMETKPYTDINGVWRLRKDISAQDINELCKPIGVLPTTHRDKQTKTPAKRAKGRQKST